MYEKEKDTYIDNLIHLQGYLRLTNREMADLLYLPLTTYNNLIYHRGGRITFEIIMRTYELNGGMMYLMTGSRPPKELEMSHKFNMLNASGKRILESVMDTLIMQRELRK